MKMLVFVLFALFVAQASAGLPTYLESQRSIDGGLQECHYSDQSVITIKADEACPPSSEADPEDTSNEIPDIDDEDDGVDE